jgi:hypothetical protein
LTGSKDVSRYTPRPRTTPLRDLPRSVPRLLNVLGFEWQVRTPRTDQAAPQEARVADRPEVTAPVTSPSTKAFVTSSMTWCSMRKARKSLAHNAVRIFGSPRTIGRRSRAASPRQPYGSQGHPATLQDEYHFRRQP